MCLYFTCPFQGGNWANRGKVANPIILIEAESQIEDLQQMKTGGAVKMCSVHPVNVSVSFQLHYKEVAENVNRIPAT